VIVRGGRPLNSVVLIHRGKANAIGPDGKLMYTYKGGACSAAAQTRTRLRVYPPAPGQS